MLDKMIALLGMTALLVYILFAATVMVGAFYQWYNLQNQAHFIAQHMSKYGGYTAETEQVLQEFCTTHKIDRSKLTIQVQPSASSAPAVYGEPVSVRLSYPFRVKLETGIGLENLFEIDLTAWAPGVSTYIQAMNPGQYISNVHYVTP